jgi:arginine-tRNA-protein transferase
MFQRHKRRFRENVPDSLETFLSAEPAQVPCECLECRVWDGEALVAVSYLDLGLNATSAVYGVFDPDHAPRSLGIFTMLKEIEFSSAKGCRFYYPGYATLEPSAYDYKKQFAALEALNWETGQWVEMAG